MKATLENYYFLGHDCINKLFGSNGQKENVPQIPNCLYDLPNRPATREVIKSEELPSSGSPLPSSAKGQQTSSGGPAEVFYTEPATHYLPSTEDTHAGKNPAQAAENPAQNSLSHEISRSFTREFLETDPNTQALSSFLAERKLIDEYSANENISNMIDRNTIDKISLHSSQPEENVNINEDQFQHLSK